MPRCRPAAEHRCPACPGESSSDSWRIRPGGPALEPTTVRSDEAEPAKCPSTRGKRRCLEPGIRESAGYARRRRHLLPLLSLSFPRDHQAAARTAAPLGLSMELDDREAGYAGAGCGDQEGNSELSKAALILARREEERRVGEEGVIQGR